MAFLAGCQQLAERANIKREEILDSFKHLDSSLVHSPENLKRHSIAGQLEMMEEEVEQGILGSSLFRINNTKKEIELTIEAAKYYLADKSEDDKHFSDDYFIRQKKRAELFTLIRQCQIEIGRSNPSYSVKDKVDSILMYVSLPNENPTDIYFKDTPVVAPIAMLNKFKPDIRSVFLLLKNKSENE